MLDKAAKKRHYQPKPLSKPVSQYYFKTMLDRGSAQEIFIRLGQWLHAKNYLAAADGNFSLWKEEGLFWITPSGVHKGFDSAMIPALVQSDGTVVEGSPSTETALHREVYLHCPRARAVIHAHPPSAIAWSIARPELRELPSDCFSEVILALGSIPIVPYARPGERELAESVRPFIQSHRAMILGRHGALSWGETVTEALNGIERMEHAALILAQAEALGGAKSLTHQETAWLKAKRTEMGYQTR